MTDKDSAYMRRFSSSPKPQNGADTLGVIHRSRTPTPTPEFSSNASSASPATTASTLANMTWMLNNMDMRSVRIEESLVRCEESLVRCEERDKDFGGGLMELAEANAGMQKRLMALECLLLVVFLVSSYAFMGEMFVRK